MKRHWFIFDKSHHLGPFTSEEIFRMYYDRKIDENRLIWKEGMSNWTRLADCHELYSIINPDAQVDATKELPPIPAHDELPPIPVEEETIGNVDEYIASYAEIAAKTRADDTHINEESSVLEVFAGCIEGQQLEETIGIREQSRWWFFGKIIFSVVSLFVFSATLYLLLWPSKKVIQIDDIGKVDIHRLTKTSLKNSGNKLFVDVALSRDREGIWFAINEDGPGTVYMTISSIEGKVLDDEKIIVKAQNDFKNRIFKMVDFGFISGSKISEGHYLLDLHLVHTGLWYRFLDFFRSFKYVSKISFLDKYQTNQYYKDNVILSVTTPVELAKKFKAKLIMERESKMAPIREIIEKYRTCFSIIEQTDKLYAQSVMRYSKGKSIIFFEKKYATQVGSLLSGVIVDSADVHLANLTISKEIADEYQKFYLFAKQIAKTVSDAIVRTGKIGKLKELNRKKLIKQFSTEMDSLKGVISVRLQKLNSEVGE